MDTLLNENDLLLIWQDNINRVRWVVGKLRKNQQYEFEYVSDNIEKLENAGFIKLIAFPDWNKKYESENLFSAFSSRLPDKRRSDIKQILETYSLDKYDEFELLKKSGGKLPTDDFEFVKSTELSDKSECGFRQCKFYPNPYPNRDEF